MVSYMEYRAELMRRGRGLVNKNYGEPARHTCEASRLDPPIERDESWDLGLNYSEIAVDRYN